MHDKLHPSAQLQGRGTSAFPAEPSVPALSTVCLFGSHFFCLNRDDAAMWVSNAIEQPGPMPLLLMHVNVHNLRSLSRVRETLQTRAPFLLEGIGLKAACFLTKGWSPPDTNGTDLFPVLLNRLRSSPCRLFLLGGGPGVAALAAMKIKESWPHVEIVGCRNGFFSNDDLPGIYDEVCRAKTNLLLIGLGSPRQEEVALEFLRVPDLQVVWTVGGLLDRLSGRIARAPPLMLRFRLEWIFRIYLEPRRLASRYLFDALWLVKSCAYEWLGRN